MALDESLRTLTADLHVHTVLSACAEVEMIPPLIVRRALDLGLGLIGITDHNASENCASVIRAASGTGLAVLPGMEVQTAEDVHVLCLFDSVEQALEWQGIVLDHLPARRNIEDVLGAQYVVDETGDYVRTEERLLATAAELSLDDVLLRVHELGGLAIPAHIDRPAFSLIASLGFVSPTLLSTPLELFRLTDEQQFRRQHPELQHAPLIRSGDAHRLSEITPAIRLRMSAPTIGELKRALCGSEGRECAIM